MTLEQFTEEFIEEIRNDSLIKGQLPSVIFLEDMIERLQMMDLIFNPTIMPFYKTISNRTLKFDAYSYDEIDKSLVLITSDFVDDVSPGKMNNGDIKDITQRMINFLNYCIDGSIRRYVDQSSDVYALSTELYQKFARDYVDLDGDQSIDRIKIFIVTNKKLSVKVVNSKIDEYNGRQVELNVWDIDRIYDVVKSGRDKEAIYIDFPKYNSGSGIPYLKADFGVDLDYDAYMAILPGKILSDIYWEHGSRLLEGNVRAFLTAKGKVNKGIRDTILKDPGKFFTYNNGIACTAKSIKMSEDNSEIVGIEDLQIINGGQTTASLTSAWKKDKSDLDKVFVPMKLTIIRSNEYDDMVQNISRYANSQNKVTDADLFSNHPFHRRFEELSLKTIAPAKQGDNHGTYWYYERSRGKYQQSLFNLTKKSEIDAFYRKRPKNQVIQKEDLAKYIMAAEYLRPDLVSKGRSKNMNEFAKVIDTQWRKNKDIFNERYYKNAVVYAIIYRKVDIIVSKATWYNVGGVKLNIVPYTISKIISSIPANYCIDFNRIWKDQDIYYSFAEEVNRIGKFINEFLNDSSGVIVTEYAKKESTWSKLLAIPLELSKDFLRDLISKSIIENDLMSEVKNQRQSNVVSAEIEVFRLSNTEDGKYWQRLLREGIIRGLISRKEEDIFRNYIFELSKPNPKSIPSTAQMKIAMEVRKRLEDKGVLV